MPERGDIRTGELRMLAQMLGSTRSGVKTLSAAGRRILAELRDRESDLTRRPGEGDAAEEEEPSAAPPAPPSGGGGAEAVPTEAPPSTVPAQPASAEGGTAPPAEQPGTAPPAEQPGTAPRPRDRCCEELVVRLERVRVKKLTSPGIFKDNVVVSGLSSGTVMNPSPLPFAWPLDSDGDIDAANLDSGEERTDTPIVARVRVGRDCAIQLDCTLTYYEEDSEDIADLLDEAARQLTAALAAKQGIVVPGSAADAIRRIIKEIARKLGLTNDIMGAYAFSVRGRLGCEADIQGLTWEPPWGVVYGHEKIDKRTARLKRTFKENDGEWETSILVQIVCPDC